MNNYFVEVSRITLGCNWKEVLNSICHWQVTQLDHVKRGNFLI
jgi:hypothetical protein